MDSRRTVLICEEEKALALEMKKALEEKHFYVEILDSPSQLLARAQRFNAAAIIVNPEINGFNEEEICNTFKRQMKGAIFFIFDRDSTTRANFADCRADHVFLKPVKLEDLINLVMNQVAIKQQ